MRLLTALLLCATLAGCAAGTAGTAGTTPSRNTTTISMGGTGPDGAMTTGTLQVNSYVDAGPATVLLHLPRDEAWQALEGVYQELGIPVGTRDLENHVLGNRKLTGRRLAGQPMSRIVRCGDTAFGAPAADSYRVQISLLTTVLPQDGGSRAETRLEATASQPAVGGSAVQCTSTGWLEERIAAGLRTRAGQ